MRLYDLDIASKQMIFTFEYDSWVVSSIKKIHGNKWHPDEKIWTVDISVDNKIQILNFISDHYFHPKNAPKSPDIVWDYSIPKDRSDGLKNDVLKLDLAYEAREYQIEYLAYALDNVSLINGDDMGLGKTFEAILYTEFTGSFPCLVIEPASVKYNWAEKWSEITKGRRKISVIESDKPQDWTTDVVIINYDIIAQKQGTGATFNFKELKENKWAMLILDEGHFLKSAGAQRSKIAKKIARKADKIQLLTGTASSNKPIELWNLLDIVGKTDKISTNWEDFVLRYCGGYKGRFGWVTDGASNVLELNQSMRESCYIRREKTQVQSQLPKVTQQIIQAPITNQKEYSNAVADIIEFIRGTKGEEKADKAAEAQHLVMINELMNLSINGKLAFIDQYLHDWREAGKGKLAIFGLRREPLEYLAKKYKSPLIVGGVTAKKKQELITSFIKTDQDFIFLNQKAGGTGIDGLQLVCCNELIIELPWTPALLDQVMARVDRSGQTNPVTITFILSNVTIDMDMWDVLAEKEVITAAINKGVDMRFRSTSLKNIIKNLPNEID